MLSHSQGSKIFKIWDQGSKCCKLFRDQREKNTMLRALVAYKLVPYKYIYKKCTSLFNKQASFSKMSLKYARKLRRLETLDHFRICRAADNMTTYSIFSVLASV